MAIYSRQNPPPGFYIYAYLRKESSTPYYIGKGKGVRAWKKSKSEIKVPDDVCHVVIMESNLTEVGALALERRYIKWYGKKCDGTGILRNVTDGGQGATGSACVLRRRSGGSSISHDRVVMGNHPLLKRPDGSSVSSDSVINGTNALLKVNRVSVTCPHCGKQGDKGNMTKWHLDNCLHNPANENTQRIIKKVTRPHCNLIGNFNSMKRWHFDNCREKK